MDNYLNFKAALRTLRHRGPDAEQILTIDRENCLRKGSDFTEEDGVKIAIGFTRLAIQDLNESSNKIFTNSQTNSVLVFNGEIYNYRELRRSLINKHGVEFSSDTDTEILLNGLEIEGIDFLRKCHGMWAFIFFDGKTNRTYASRDMLGQKPLYYAQLNDNRTIVSSEIKAILRIHNYKNLNEKVVYDFLRFGLADHTEETFYEGIKKFEPGYLYDISKGLMKKERYREIDTYSDASTDNDLRKSLEISINRIIPNDVETFAFLSGGLDSSIIAYLASRNLRENGRKLHLLHSSYSRLEDLTETINPDFLKLLPNAELHTYQSNKSTFLESMNDFFSVHDEPFNTTAMFASFNLFRFARNQFDAKVVLVGDGADELFGGYGRVYGSLAFNDLVKSGNYSEITRYSHGQLRELAPKVLFQRLPLNLMQYLSKHHHGVSQFIDKEFYKRYQHRDAKILNERYKVSLKQRLVNDTEIYNLPHILRYLDSNSMANSIEARAPFLEKEVLRSAFADSKTAINFNSTKVQLRSAFPEILSLVENPGKSKSGFGAKEQFWFVEYMKNFDSVTLENSYIDIQSIVDTIEFQAKQNDEINQQLWLGMSLALFLTRLQVC